MVSSFSNSLLHFRLTSSFTLLFLLALLTACSNSFLGVGAGTSCGGGGCCTASPCCCCCPKPSCGQTCCCPPACHYVARRCCCQSAPSSPPCWQDNNPLLPQSSFPQLILSSDLSGVSAAYGGGDHSSLTIPDQSNGGQQFQPVVYVIGGAPLVPSSAANKTSSSGDESPTVSEASGDSNSNDGKGTSPSDDYTNRTAGSKTPSNSPSLNNLVPKLKVQIHPSSKKNTLAPKGSKAGKQFDDDGNAEAQPLLLNEYEEADENEENKMSAKRAIKAFGAELFERRDTFLRGLLKRKLANVRAKRISSGHPTSGQCNSKRMASIMARAIVDEMSIAKRLVKRALEYSFVGEQFGVICSVGGKFSYTIYGRRYCEVEEKGVTCIAFG